MGKKLGLDKAYSSLLTTINKNSPSTEFMNRRLTLSTPSSKSIGKKLIDNPVLGSRLLSTALESKSKTSNILKTATKNVFKRSPIGRIIDAGVKIGAGVGAGYSYAKEKFKPDNKMAGGMAKKYSTGMTLADMKPYGGSYVKKKAEMKASQTKNVKQLTTSDDAYSPEKMFVVTRGTKKGNRATPTRIRVTDDWNAKKIVDRENSKGINTKSFASYKLPPAYQRDYLRTQQLLQNLRDKPRSYSGPTKKMATKKMAGGMAENRGMGLQDESMKPGKIMKAKYGKEAKIKKVMKEFKKGELHIGKSKKKVKNKKQAIAIALSEARKGKA